MKTPFLSFLSLNATFSMLRFLLRHSLVFSFLLGCSGCGATTFKSLLHTQRSFRFFGLNYVYCIHFDPLWLFGFCRFLSTTQPPQGPREEPPAATKRAAKVAASAPKLERRQVDMTRHGETWRKTFPTWKSFCAKVKVHKVLCMYTYI